MDYLKRIIKNKSIYTLIELHFRLSFIILALLIYSSFKCYAQDYITIDTVYSFKPGTGQNEGQDSAYFPKNIFGLPSEQATAEVPEIRPEYILSLGLGGEIIIGAKNKKVFNIPGADFIIYENSFISPFTGQYFAEPAVVSVSKDGVNFIEFPFDSATLQGCAGIKPTVTKGKNYDPYNCGGDAFDLEDVGLYEITHIKIKDITGMLLDNPQHKYYNPILSGFDLDAVVLLGAEGHTGIDYSDNLKYINSDEIFFVETSGISDFYIFDLSGRLIYSDVKTNNISVIKSRLNRGVYFVRIINERSSETIRFVN